MYYNDTVSTERIARSFVCLLWATQNFLTKMKHLIFFLVATMTSVGHPHSHTHTQTMALAQIFKAHFLKTGFFRGLDNGCGTFQQQIASMILAQADNNVNV